MERYLSKLVSIKFADFCSLYLLSNNKLCVKSRDERTVKFFSVRVQSWSDKIESDPVLIRKFLKITSPIQSLFASWSK